MPEGGAIAWRRSRVVRGRAPIDRVIPAPPLIGRSGGGKIGAKIAGAVVQGNAGAAQPVECSGNGAGRDIEGLRHIVLASQRTLLDEWPEKHHPRLAWIV